MENQSTAILPIPKEDLIHPDRCFRVITTKTMCKPMYQMTLPSRVEKKLNPFNEKGIIRLWVILSPVKGFNVDFYKQEYKRGGWRSFPKCGWQGLCVTGEIEVNEVLTFERIPHSDEFCYRLRSPRLDKMNLRYGYSSDVLTRMFFRPHRYPGVGSTSSRASGSRSKKKKAWKIVAARKEVPVGVVKEEDTDDEAQE